MRCFSPPSRMSSTARISMRIATPATTRRAFPFVPCSSGSTMSVRRLAVARHLGWLLGISVVSSATAQTTPAEVRAQRILDSARTSIELATAAGDVNAIHGIQVLLERALAVAPSDPWLLHYLGYATYREATLRMEGSRNDNATLLQRADSIIQLSLSFKDISESYALHSSLLGLMIGSSPLRAMTNGPKI